MRERKRSTETVAASTAFYCSWGRHRTWESRTVGQQFATGTMCMACQITIATNLTKQIFMPDISASLREHERRTMVAHRERKAVVDKITGGEPETGFVYYIRINGQIKIGYSKDVTQRMRHYPPASELLAVEPGTPHTEKERHQEFARDLERGREWFKESVKLSRHIQNVRETLGDPQILAYKFTTPKM